MLKLSFQIMTFKIPLLKGRVKFWQFVVGSGSCDDWDGAVGLGNCLVFDYR